jgi:hypothetical protein
MLSFLSFLPFLYFLPFLSFLWSGRVVRFAEVGMKQVEKSSRGKGMPKS